MKMLIVCLFVLAACTKKPSSTVLGPSSLTIVNAVNGSAPLVTNFSGTDSLSFYDIAAQIVYGSFLETGAFSGSVSLALYQYPDTLYGKDQPLLALSLTLPPGSIHSLFLTGSTTTPDTLFTTDVLPSYTDSVVGIRMVNLVPGMSGYKGISGFAAYPSNAESTTLTLYFTDPATGDTVNTFTLYGNGTGLGDPNNGNTLLFKNVTIALYGTPGNTATMLIDNY